MILSRTYNGKEMIPHGVMCIKFLVVRHPQLFAGMNLQALLEPQSRASVQQPLLNKVSSWVSDHTFVLVNSPI